VKGGFITLKVYDIQGKEITTLVNESKTAGLMNLIFQGTEYQAEYIFTHYSQTED